MAIDASKGAKMGQPEPVKEAAEQVIKEICRAMRPQSSAEEKIRIVLSGLRGEDSIAEVCHREGIVQNLYCRWSKEFLEPARSAWHATRRARQPRRRSGICAGGPPR
jgi:transposase-like protein